VSLPATLVSRPVTFDQLVALSDEIAALSRAGVPLDRGLSELGRDLPGRLGSLAGEIGHRLERGEDLARIVADSKGMFPPAYHAVIAAGMRAGRLPAALEDVTRAARKIRALRTTIGMALLYPLAVMLIAWSLFIFGVVRLLPVMIRILQDVNVDLSQWDQAAARLAQTSNWWGPIVPGVLMLWLLWVWFRTGQVEAGVELHPLLAWGAMGSLRRMQRAGRMAALTELLSLLVANNVPLDEAVELASAAVGSPRLAAGGRELAERIRRGQIGGPAPRGFAPLLCWTLSAGNQQNLPQLLHRAAQTYREEFDRRAQWLSLYVPLVATALVAGGVVMLYAMLSLGPWIVVMHRLASPYME
jgi:general secretion pathway protein F